MTIDVHSISQDLVINAKYISGQTTYAFGIKKLIPLINKLDIQRDLQDPKFYRRLERDLLKGCIMPPITLAFITEKDSVKDDDVPIYINENIENAFVLDGIQRLNTLKRASENYNNLDVDRPLFLNIIICYSMDNLLYRMITLNNGQKPMTARHQIEILANNIYDFDTLSIKVRTEKERKRATNGAFKKADIVKAYIAFLSNSTNIDNRKIIEQKMDELVADRILDSNITDDDVEFEDAIGLVDRLCENSRTLAWFQVNNNLIGFAVGIKESFTDVKETTNEDFSRAVENFEKAFSGFDISKFNVGQQRRKLASYFIANYKKLFELGENDLLQILSEVL